MLALHKIFFFLIFILFCPYLSAQNEVPNIILTDIQGNERNLYESLEDGKVVIVEVFSTWCSNCWETNQSNVLQRIYNTYGPEGTQQLEIFYIEGDRETDLLTIFGDGSFGDWTEDKTYPIFSPMNFSGEFFETFAPNGLPTSNVICPQSKEIIADIYQSSLSEIIDVIQMCNTISDVNDVQIVKPMESTLAICQPTDLRFSVLNTGTEVISSLSIHAFFADGTSFNQLDYNTTLDPGESVPINFGEIDLADNLDFQNLDLIISTPDDIPSNNLQPITIRHAESVSNKIFLKITSDAYVETDSTGWWIENSTGDIVIPLTYLINDETLEMEIPLENSDCFTFIITDNYGDGFLLGDIELTTEDGVVIFDETNFMFRGEACFEFAGSVTSTDFLEASEGYGLTLQSNLIQDDVNVEIKLPTIQDVSLNVIDLSGRSLITKAISAPDTQFAHTTLVQELGEGIYFIQLVTDQGILTKKFIKQ